MMKLTDEQQAHIQGLRELADFLEAHPDLPWPYAPLVVNVFTWEKEELARVARVGGSWEKGTSADYFFLRRTFAGNVRYEVNINRSRVCRKVVTGTAIIPEQVVEAYEWVCDEPILKEEVNHEQH